jgi:hypothetical protein
MVIADDVVGMPRVQYRQGGTTKSDSLDLIAQSMLRPSSPSTVKAFAKGLGHGFGFRFPGEFCQRGCKLFRLLVSNIEGHVFTTCRQ